ncbi:eCIS core domain-containing protein [Mangrovimicrobium sediminis]|uniref:eCIS core domain-containing protein n=1 Tax=Mangrovimicrobium sediminis TaxID=2562682 RepID=UPI00198185EB|nr:DUF4157 domain-containing protein [Haliea sp. SAOS-164]
MHNPAGNQATQRAAHGGNLPPRLQAAYEARSGIDLSDVRVHRNSAEPGLLRAHAVTRGRDIHLAGGAERYLAHETWHAVQQRQGRVSGNATFAGRSLDTNPELEAEAERVASAPLGLSSPVGSLRRAAAPGQVSQLAPNQQGTADPADLIAFVQALEAQGMTNEEILERIQEDHATNAGRYVYTDEHGWVDLRHFGAAAGIASGYGSVAAETLGFGNEVMQWLTEWGDDYRSGFSPEDIPSNAAGGSFGDDYVNGNEALSDSLQRWLDDMGARSQDDPLAGRSSLPETDPSERGGEDRGSSNASRTQSTVSDNQPVNEFTEEWNAGWRALATPGGWYRLFGL